MTVSEPRQPDREFDLERAIGDDWPPESWQNVTILLAISGGADSVALLRAMVALKPVGAGSLVVAHFNHQTREAASNEDERFVLDLCRCHGLPCKVGRPEDGPKTSDSEQSWRAERYRFLETTAEEVGARYVVTAHTADDQAETILHRIIRGTGLRGLAGIPRVRALGHASLMRPMLGVHRKEVIAYLARRQQNFRNDASNDECRFTRNRIRHELLPHIVHDYNPQAVEALLRLGTLAGNASDALQATVIDGLWQDCATAGAKGEVVIDCERLRDELPYVIHEVLIRAYRTCGWPMQGMGQQQWETLGQMVQAQAGVPPTIMLPGAIRASRDRQRLILRQTTESSSDCRNP